MTNRSFVLTRDSSLLSQEDYSTSHVILAYYHLVSVADPRALMQQHFDYIAQFTGEAQLKGRIYVASQGINGTLSAPWKSACAYIRWLTSLPEFTGAEFKVQEHPDHVFERMIVKVKKELVAIGQDIPLELKGQTVSAAEWRAMLETEKEALLLDIRNEYEWLLGHFENAIAPPCATFKEFKQFAKDLVEKIDVKNKKVMMYCTGGIRCEFFSALLREQGVENVYQLDGGIIKYGMEEKSAHWLGKLFVFDDRLSAPISDEEAPVIAKCHHCGQDAEQYYNCANMDCNNLFICCDTCLQSHKGCCQDSCAIGKRVRPYKHASAPFRRWYHYAKTKEELDTLKAT